MKNIKDKKPKTTYLLPKNSLLIGLGSILNIFGVYFTYNYSNSETEADNQAISCDWSMVGSDFRNILNN